MLSNIDPTIEIKNEIITINNDFKTGLKSGSVNSKSTLSTILNVSPTMIKIIPLTPATPNPGIANISSPTRTTPSTKMTISQFSAKPPRYNGAKYKTAAIKDAKIGNPTPGVCNSK